MKMVIFITHSLFIPHKRTLMELVGIILEETRELIIAISLTAIAITMESKMTSIHPVSEAKQTSTVTMVLN